VGLREQGQEVVLGGEGEGCGRFKLGGIVSSFAETLHFLSFRAGCIILMQKMSSGSYFLEPFLYLCYFNVSQYRSRCLNPDVSIGLSLADINTPDCKNQTTVGKFTIRLYS
jgi:hypothetical protein